jgi:maltose alpha-D-glucosyltransferase/alpha-amylase
MTLAAHGFYWLKLTTDVSVPSWHVEQLPAEDRPVLVLFDGWNSLFRELVVPWRIGMAVKTRQQFEDEILPRYIETQRWYAAKSVAPKRARLVDQSLWEHGADRWMLPLVEVEGAGTATYFVPLAIVWEDREEERYKALAPAAVARIRQQAEVGLMADAFSDERFCRAVIEAIGENHTVPTANGAIRFTPTSEFAHLAADIAQLPIARPQAQSSNTIVTVNDRLFLKGYRVVRNGVNPELEVGRFLTEVAHFPNCAPVAGAVEYVGNDGSTRTLCLLQAHVSNQGDGWTYALNYLSRYFEQVRTAIEPLPDDVHGAHLALMQTLGKRTAELHLAMTTRSDNPAFEPEAMTPADFSTFRQQTLAEARTTFELLEAAQGKLSGATLETARAVLAMRARVMQRIEAVGQAVMATTLKIRIHGDYHLAQVLLTRNDFVLVDFEGEPGRGFDERRAKQSPLRDVAGMLRSFGYAYASAVRAAAHTAEEEAQLEQPAARWEALTRRAFLDSYAATLASSGLRMDDTARSLLPLFELQKALYELRYELDNRPDWVGIPLAGILGFIDGEQSGAGPTTTEISHGTN